MKKNTKINIESLTELEKSNLVPRISVVTKLDGIKSWSLQAGNTCPGSYNNDGSIIEVCTNCYAKGGNYRFRNVKDARSINKIVWRHGKFVDNMVALLNDSRYFRWFDSGDMYSLKLATKIYKIMKNTPHCLHWIPTKMDKFEKFKPIIAKMKALENVSVRISSDSIHGDYTVGYHGSTVIKSLDNVPVGVEPCLAYENVNNACNGCRKCWDKKIPVIGYVGHGQKIKSAYKHIAISVE